MVLPQFIVCFQGIHNTKWLGRGNDFEPSRNMKGKFTLGSRPMSYDEPIGKGWDTSHSVIQPRASAKILGQYT